MKYLLPIALLLFFFPSCGDDEIESPPDDLGYEYFPLEVGKYKAYKVDSTLFDGGNISRNSTTYRREEIVSQDLDLQNDMVYTIDVFVKSDLNDLWIQTGSVVEKRSTIRAERAEDNLRFIKLTFPLRSGSSWDGNAFINPDLEYIFEGERVEVYRGWTDKYSVSDDPQPLTIDTFVFDNTVSVLESSEDNTISLRESMSIYAANVGLIKRTQRILGLSCNGTPMDPCHDATAPWEDDAEFGYSVTQTIIDFN